MKRCEDNNCITTVQGTSVPYCCMCGRNNDGGDYNIVIGYNSHIKSQKVVDQILLGDDIVFDGDISSLKNEVIIGVNNNIIVSRYLLGKINPIYTFIRG